jgi:hypothetical protein
VQIPKDAFCSAGASPSIGGPTNYVCAGAGSDMQCFTTDGGVDPVISTSQIQDPIILPDGAVGPFHGGINLANGQPYIHALDNHTYSVDYKQPDTTVSKVCVTQGNVTSTLEMGQGTTAFYCQNGTFDTSSFPNATASATSVTTPATSMQSSHGVPTAGKNPIALAREALNAFSSTLSEGFDYLQPAASKGPESAITR